MAQEVGKDDSNLPNREELLQLAITSAQQGNKDGARTLFERVLNEDKRNERALMWMAKLSETKSERVKWLNLVLKVNPDNEQAQSALKKMQYKSSAKENRTLLIIGMILGVLIILGVVIVLGILISQSG
jgi:lipopolysaccharide biosynthesis regulator YciM